MTSKTMPPANTLRRLVSKLRWHKLATFWKVTAVILAAFIVTSLAMYGVSSWYRLRHDHQPFKWGMSWSSKYAAELGLDPIEGLQEVVDELPIKRLRLMSYWDLHEREKDNYDWSLLDEQMRIAEKANLEVSLSIGLRQPRFPECHWPTWAQSLDEAAWRRELNQYIIDTVSRYKDRQVVVEFQLENEFLLTNFGDCPDHERQRLIDEFKIVNALTAKTIVISRSNALVLGWPIGQPRADLVGASLYKRVYWETPIAGYKEYPFPAWYYSFLAGMTELTTGRQSFIHELQAEPWGPVITANLSSEQQAESLDAKRLGKRLDYAHATGMRSIDIWGAEWAYWRKTKFNDDSIWQVYVNDLPKYN